jgi:hypothetical protein
MNNEHITCRVSSLHVASRLYANVDKGGIFLGDNPHPEDLPLHPTAFSRFGGHLIPLRVKIWNALTAPETSRVAATIAVIVLSAIIASITVLCLETYDSISSSHERLKIIDAIEAACVCIFAVEYVCKLLAAPNRYRFAVDILNIFDLLSILPFFINFSICGSVHDCIMHGIYFAGV